MLGNEYKGHFWFFLKRQVDLYSSKRKTTGHLENKSQRASQTTTSSSASAEVCSAPWAGLSNFLHLWSTALSACTQPLCTLQQLPAQPQPCSSSTKRMAAAKTEILPTLQISEPLSFPHSPMDNYPKLEEVMMLSSAGTPFLTASAPEGAGFGSGEPGEQYDHLAGGKSQKILLLLHCM